MYQIKKNTSLLRLNIRIIFLYTFLLFILLSEKTNALENKIIYKINNEIITSLDISNEIKYLNTLNPNLKDLDKKTITNIAQNSLIREKIKEIEIKKNTKSLKLKIEYLNVLIKNIYLKLNLNSISEFQNYLKINSLNIETVKEKIAIEALWNELIFAKFSNKIKINKENLRKIILAKNYKTVTSYNLKEIIFEISSKKDVESKYKTIKSDIIQKGFSNTALLYSVSENSKIGGKLGWVSDKLISNKIKKEILLLKIGEHTKPIIIPGGALILKLMDIKKEELKIDLDKELKKLINIEKNKQLNQYSNMYYNKIKKDIDIDEL